GAGGAKGGGQGESGPAKHALDSEPGSRVTGAGAYTASNCRHTPEVGEAMGRAAEVVAPSSSIRTDGGCPVVKINDLSRSLAAFDPISTLAASVAVSRERKRAKTDRLDAAMLMRVFLGWLRGERGHCGMVAIPTMEEEDARRPNRERESLVNERSRIVNRMKSALARLGIRGFKPHLRKAPERLAGLRTAEGTG